MDLFFTRRYKYIVNDTTDNVRRDFESITTRRWHDFSENITGRLKNDGSFTLTHKWSFAVIKWIENSPAYLSGTLEAEGDKTKINVVLRPNSAFVLFFYLLAFLFIIELIGFNTFIEGPKLFKLLFFPFFNLILYGLMQMFATGLKNRFERMMKVDPHDELPTTADF